MKQMKNISIVMVCGVLMSCSGAKPTPTAQPGEAPSPPSSSPDINKAGAPSRVEQRTDLEASRVVIASPLDAQQVWQDLSVQREVARTYGARKSMCEALEANDSDECGKNAECTSRIQPDCEQCNGGKLVCVAKDSDRDLQAFYGEQAMLQCLEMSGTTWHIYQGEPPAPADRIYQQCICDEPLISSIDSYIKQGATRPNPQAGMCISEKASCEQDGGVFQEARLLGKVSPEDYEAHGVSVRLTERPQWCNVSVTRPSKAAKDDVFVGVVENDACVIYRFKGYEVKRSHEEASSSHSASYLPHTCDMP